MPLLMPRFRRCHQAGHYHHTAAAAAALPLHWGVHIQNSKKSKL
jgi:hypothetical protein